MRTRISRAGAGGETKIIVGAGVRAQLAAEVAALGSDRRVFALVDSAVADLHPSLVPRNPA